MVEVRTSTPNLDRIERESKYLKTHGVKVGIIGDETNDDGVRVKDYATFLILGTSTMPPRDFMRAVRGRKGRLEIARFQKSVLSKVFTGELTGKQALNQIGIFAVQKIKQEILEGNFAPLKQSTIDKKTRNKNNILIDTSRMFDSIAYEVVTL